jgi:Sulfatase
MSVEPALAHDNKPNIVFILVDNVGWGTFGAYGGTIPTPRIDEIAKQGIRFNNYNVEAQCTPTRSAILTGRYSVRSGTYTVPLPGQGVAGLAPWEYTIAKLLSDAGYATALFSKWHLGNTQGRLPNDQGFDEWWGIKDSWDEAGYTAYPLFKESGLPVPMIYEGKKGEPSEPVMPLDLTVRPIVDGQYIIPQDGRVHQAQRRRKEAILRLCRLLRGAPAGDRQPGFRRQVHQARRPVCRCHR